MKKNLLLFPTLGVLLFAFLGLGAVSSRQDALEAVLAALKSGNANNLALRFEETVELTLPDNSSCLGLTVEEIALPENSALAAIVRDGRVITPKLHEVFTAGDELLFVATAEAEDLLKQCFIAN